MRERPEVAIVDHAHGNLRSVLRACEHVGLDAEITSDPKRIDDATAVILPGVGAFGEAMRVMEERDLIGCLQDVAASGRFLIGICLGFQLLFTESEEFGRHRGLDLLRGHVVRLDDEGPLVLGERVLKVPQIGWNRVDVVGGTQTDNALLEGVGQQPSFYFLHSYFVRPEIEANVVGWTTYGGLRYCSVAARDNVIGFQFHPERSGNVGLQIYANLKAKLRT